MNQLLIERLNDLHSETIFKMPGRKAAMKLKNLPHCWFNFALWIPHNSTGFSGLDGYKSGLSESLEIGSFLVETGGWFSHLLLKNQRNTPAEQPAKNTNEVTGDFRRYKVTNLKQLTFRENKKILNAGTVYRPISGNNIKMI